MNKLELMKTANEVRKGIVTAVHVQKRTSGRISVSSRYFYISVF